MTIQKFDKAAEFHPVEASRLQRLERNPVSIFYARQKPRLSSSSRVLGPNDLLELPGHVAVGRV